MQNLHPTDVDQVDKVRQAEKRGTVRRVLSISLGLAVVALALVTVGYVL